MIEFNHFNFNVLNLEKSIAFYKEAIGLSVQRMNAKINSTGGAEFTMSEIRAIKIRYGLKSEEIDDIFFCD